MERKISAYYHVVLYIDMDYLLEVIAPRFAMTDHRVCVCVCGIRGGKMMVLLIANKGRVRGRQSWDLIESEGLCFAFG